MANQIRSVDFLPQIFQTPVNTQFLSATLDQLIQEPKYKQTQGFIGQKTGPGVNPNDNYVIEPTAARNNYQLEPGVVSLDPTTSALDDVITYPGILDALSTQGGIVDQADRLFESEYYSWDPFVDFDKLNNYAQYYWLPNGPDAVTVAGTAVPTTQTFTVTRANGAYTFSGYTGDNPAITLVRNGNYQFVVAQNTADAIDFRVTNNGTSSWAIDYQPNPTLTLVRGNTYSFNLIQSLPLAFYIKTELSYGTTNIWSEGVSNNGATQGLVIFTVPQDAPDVLYYCNDLEFNLRGQLNIVDATAGTGPDFWIQTQPGINGVLPWSPNISSRDVLGVSNNGIDLGTVSFNVPASTAQDFYYSLTNIGRVDLIADSQYQFDKINGVTVASFLASYPTGIDGITNINNRTLVFTTQTANPELGGWYYQSPFSPQVRTSPPNVPDPVDGQAGTFDATPFDQSTPITDPAIQFGVWRANYVTVNGVQFIQLTSVQNVATLSQFTVSSGTEWVNTQWWKNSQGFYVEMPALTASLPTLFYQDSKDPNIFGTINLINQNSNASIDVDLDILGHASYTSPNGVTFTNGLKVIFQGAVTPASYQGNSYYVQGVGTGIVLLPVSEFVVPETYAAEVSSIQVTNATSTGTEVTLTYVTQSYIPFVSGEIIIVTGVTSATGDYNGVFTVLSATESQVVYTSTAIGVYISGGKIDAYGNQPLTPDYITISQASIDLNPWTRSNRWFHTDVLKLTAAYNKTSPSYVNVQRAKRPILEFRAGTKLFNFGSDGVIPVNVIDFTQTNALENVNGQTGYGTDGYTLVQGSLIIFAADANPIVRNNIYQVTFIVPNPADSTPIIDLVLVAEYDPILPNQSTVCLNGLTLTGVSFYYNGSEWVKSQQKTAVNQPPLFDVFDSNGNSFGDIEYYPSTNFTGCKLLSYAENPDNPVDSVLGFPLAYFSIDNIGDILFDNNLYTDTFVYTKTNNGITVDVSTGFVRQYSTRLLYTTELGWQTAAIPSLSRQQFQFNYSGQPLQLDVLAATSLGVPAVQIFINNVYQLPSSFTLSVNASTNTTVITLTGVGYVTGDIIEVLVYSSEVSNVGFYQVPVNLENNPFNGNSSQFSLGTIRQHYATICENLLGFQGTINGPNNTRDLGNIVPYGQQILQQSSPLTLAGYFLRSINYDIFASIEYNSREYVKYKNKLLTAVTQLNIGVGQSISSILDAAIQRITVSFTSSSPFYWSDMLPTGTNYTSNSTTVNPVTTAIFNTVQTYNFTSSNYLGLLVYVNGALLLRGTQYVVSTEAPKLTILIPLNVGDVVTINEYHTTVPSWCPNTPSKMGLYPKYTPSIYLDETYSEPTVVIQGHDGSITVAFGDIRDQVLLEFEKRIYDNIKVDDNPIPLTTDEVDPNFYPAQTTALLPGFFRNTPYTYTEVNQILSESFLTWVGQNKIDYTQQNYIPDNPFSYNFGQSANRIDGTEFLQGNWRGIYRYFYDTETPNSTPWEMVGFSEEPNWWVQRYGPAPYTSGNAVLWDDLEAGIVGDPAGPYLLSEYARPGLSKVIPAGSEGELLSPLECVVGKTDPLSYQASWAAGDGGPVQASWWNSSSYPFAIMRLLALTKPAQFFSLFADRDLYRYNTTLGQYLYNGRYRLNASGVQVYGNGVSKASYINWIVDYYSQTGVNSTTALTEALANLDVRLCYRMASFSDPIYLQLFTERAGPNSTNNSLLIPSSSYDLLFYKNQPFNQITYSSVIVTVTELATGGTGYAVFGYSNVQPYFEVLISNPFGPYQPVTAGGITVKVPTQYTANTTLIPYGYVFTNATSVCDFLLSYGGYLENQGIVFNNVENGYTLNWQQMAQEFLYFSSQGWTPGTMINLNPCATKITASQPISIVDTIASVTPENMLLDQNHKVLDVRTMVVFRDGNTFSVSTTNGQTINFLTLKFTNYEDMVVLNNTSQYQDLIYDPVTAARQSRLSLIASTTTEWDGQLNAQGFILNLNNVKQWQSYTKYTKGQIVLYKNTYWQAITISQPQETFNYNDWIKSNYQLIDQGLLPNLANKADQLVSAYDVYQANLTSDNDLFAFGLIGFRPRQYMTDMNLNSVTQVQLYQQFIGIKGTRLAAQVFGNANLGKESGQYNVYENWGVLSGTYGAQANRSYFEIKLNQSLLSYNPSTIQIIVPGQTSQANQTVFVDNLWRESYRITSPNVLPTTYENSNLPTALPTAGYVCLDDVDVTVFSIDDPSAINADLNNIGIGTYIWIAKINSYNWGVYRVAEVPGQMRLLTNGLNGTSTVSFSAAHGLAVADLIIIKYFNPAVNGVYRVLAIPSITTVTIAFTFTNTNLTSVNGTGLVFRLQPSRVSQASDISKLDYVNNLLPGDIVWVDNDSNGHWETLQKQAPFVVNATIVPEFTAQTQYGLSVAQTINSFGALVGAPGSNSGAGAVLAYFKGTTTDYQYSTIFTPTATGSAGFGNLVNFGNQNWAVVGASASLSGVGYATMIYRNSSDGQYSITQLLVPPDQNFSAIGFGTSGIISADEHWMYIGAPGNNIVYAYERIDVVDQFITYTTDGVTTSFEYSSAIQIDYTEINQLIVTLGPLVVTPNVDYTITSNNVVFIDAPFRGQPLSITRRQQVQLDQEIYSNISQNSTSGIGRGATFTVTNTRGVYQTILTYGGSAYNVGDTLTINGNVIGGATPANNLIIVVTVVAGGVLVGFTTAGGGISNTSSFDLSSSLYTASNIYSFAVVVNSQIQRPYLDYTFNNTTSTLTFLLGSIPTAGAAIIVTSGTYWQYVSDITASDSVYGDNFGASVGTTTDGRQIVVGAPSAEVNTIGMAGKSYVFDRSVIRYIVSNASQTTYPMSGTINSPVAVSVNNVFLLTTEQSVTGQYTVSGNNIVFSNITFTVGDIIQIETNEIQQIQEFNSSTPSYEAKFSTAIDVCPLNCSLYAAAPFDSTYIPQAGSVDHLVNQSRVYGVTTSTIANPILTASGTLRINDSIITVPPAPSNTVTGFANAINNSGIPNVAASATPNLNFVGDGTTKVFYIGTLYSSASSYTTVVNVNGELQTEGVDYSYDNTSEQIYFVYAPARFSDITVVSGRLTISVLNSDAAVAGNMVTVLPGVVNSVFNLLGFDTFVFTQQILSPAPTVYGQFGAALSIDTNAVSLIVGSPNGNIYEATTFDAGQTYFDEHSTTIYNAILNCGVAYTYDYFPGSTNSLSNPGQFAFGQQIYNSSAVSGDRFAVSVNYTTGRLLIGAPAGWPDNTTNLSYATVFDNPTNSPAWAPIRTQQPVVDVYAINGVFSYNGGQAIGVNVTATAGTQTYFDFFDPLQGKILGVARQNIDYIGAVDPAQYNIGSIHNNGNVWGREHLGEMWWDTNTVRFIDPNQDDIVYASRRWGTTFPGSSVDIYQWVESSTPPANYTGAGTPLSAVSYSVSSQLGQNNIFQTLYYFWVKGITTIASGAGKTLSPSGVSSYITDPRSSGLPYIAGLNASTIAIYNAQNLLEATNTILSIGFDREINDAVVHQEYQIITDGIANSFLNTQLYRKLLDSLCGVDIAGNAVPDPTLSLGMQFGVQFRPRQSMFADRFTALQNYLGRANTVLAQYPISETRSFALLNSVQPIPTASSGAWNFEVPNLEILGYQNLAIVPVGYRYLVLSDSSQQGRWTIYQVQSNKSLYLVQVQSYNTPLYWYYINWYQPGYNSSVAPIAAVQNYGQLATLPVTTAPVGSSVRVISNGAGKWEIYLRTGLGTTNDWMRVGLEDGTIAFSQSLWNYAAGNFGFDADVFDAQYFDETPQVETRFILRALNEEIYIDDLQIERNSSLILMFNYVYSEFTDPSWLIKTSYVDVNHNIRSLLPYQTYLQDNQNFVLDYFQEVKPYHVQVRQFNLIYSGEDDFLGDLTDFDLPAYWDSALEIPQFVSPILTPYDTAITPVYSTASDAAPNAQIWVPPSLYNQWYTNYLLSIQSVAIANGGSGYTVAPTITVTGTCTTPAVMTAVINGGGQVTAINIVDPGTGYLTTAIINIVGGNGIGAQAVAYMGNGLVRSIKTTIKYDRYEYQTTIIDWISDTTYTTSEQVRYDNAVWQANSTITNTIFDPSQWTLVNASELSGVDRTMGYYVSTPDTPGLSLPLLIDGIDYPGVQVEGLNFNINPGFGRGGFAVLPFNNLSYDANGKPTYYIGLLDTIFESSYVDPYLGTRATDINVSGGAYVDTFESHAPEELVPGIEFDTLDYRVYTTPGADWQGVGHGFPQNLVNVIYDATQTTISFANQLPYPVALVITDDTRGKYLVSGIDYTVDWVTQTFTILSSSVIVVSGDQLGINVFELGGGNQLFKGVYNGAEVSNSLTVPVEYGLIYEFAIFVNGIYLSSDSYAYTVGAEYGTTLIDFDSTYTSNDYISLVAIGPTTIDGVTTDYSWSIPVTQTIVATGSIAYHLDNSLEYTNPVNAIVTLAGARARTAAGIAYLGDGVSTLYEVAQRLGIDQLTILPTDVSVYLDDVPQDFSTYTVNPSAAGTLVIFNTAPESGVRIYLAVTAGAQAIIDPVSKILEFVPGQGLMPFAGQIITVTTWNDTREQRALTQVFVGPVVVGETISEGFDTTAFDPLFVPAIEPADHPGPFPATQLVVGHVYQINAVGTTDFTVIGAPNNNVNTVFTVQTEVPAVLILPDSVFYCETNTTKLVVGGRIVISGSLETGTGMAIIPSLLPQTFDNTPFDTGLFSSSPEGEQTFYIVTTNGSTKFQLSETLGGAVIVTTPGATTGLSFNTQAAGNGNAIEMQYIRDSSTNLYNNEPGSFNYTEGTTVSTNNLVLGSVITDASRLWVSLNGKILNAAQDFILETTTNGSEIILSSGTLQPTDTVMVTQFTNYTVPESMAFRIFQDMRGVQATYRITDATTTTTASPVELDDDIIYVVNAGALTIPNFMANIWGVVTVDGERIMYRSIDLVNNSISDLLRGTAGTGVATHNAGAYVYDEGRGNLLPEQFQNYIVSNTTLADGITTEFIAVDISLRGSDSVVWVETDSYFGAATVVDGINYYYAKQAVPANTSITDTTYWQPLNRAVLVYVGGMLQTSGYTFLNENPVSIEFTTAPADGVDVTILVKRGVTWYAQGTDTASNGVPLQETDTAAAKFLRGD